MTVSSLGLASSRWSLGSSWEQIFRLSSAFALASFSNKVGFVSEIFLSWGETVVNWTIASNTATKALTLSLSN